MRTKCQTQFSQSAAANKHCYQVEFLQGFHLEDYFELKLYRSKNHYVTILINGIIAGVMSKYEDLSHWSNWLMWELWAFFLSYFFEAQPLFLLNTYGIPYFVAVSKYYVLI